jgi:hypothetical protein
VRWTLIILLTFFIVQFATAASEILKVEDLHKKSEVLLKESAATKTDAERAAKLLALKKEINTARDAYSKTPETEDSDAHEAVATFYYNLEPVFNLVEEKKFPARCASTKGKIQLADSQGRPEGAPLTKNASIALEWLKVFCK